MNVLTMTTWVAVYGWGPDTDAPALVVYSTATSEATACDLADKAANTFGREHIHPAADQEPQLWTVLRVPSGQLPPQADETSESLYVAERG